MMREAIRGELQHPEELTPAEKQLSLQLYNIGAVKFGDFRLKLHDTYPEFPLSPVYIDLNSLRRFPEVMTAAVDVYQDLVYPLEFDLLADVPTGATPFVSSLSARLGVGMITPRTDHKAHGSGAKIDGLQDSDKGKVAVLIDDLVTRADSKMEAADILKAHGVKVHDVVVLIDREQGGREQLKEAGYNLHSAFTMRQMFDFYLRGGILTKEAYQETLLRLEVFVSNSRA